MTLSVMPYKGFEKRRNKSGSATLGKEQTEVRQYFGYDPNTYVRDGQAKSKFGKFGNLRKSGKSGGTDRSNSPHH